MNTNDGARSCPFCGSNQTRPEEIDIDSWSVVCGICGVIGPVTPGRMEAIARWNWRSIPHEPTGAATLRLG